MGILSLLARPKPSIATPHAGPWPLSFELLRWTPHRSSRMTIADALQDVIVFGQKGSGKSSGSGRALSLAYLRAGFSGIVACAHRTEADVWRRYLQETGRSKDGIFFSLDSPWRFNPLLWEAGKSTGFDFSEHVVNLITDLAGIKKAAATGTNEAHFWGPQRRKRLRSIISLLALAGEPITLERIYRVMMTAPRTADEANAPARAGKDRYALDCLHLATERSDNAKSLGSLRHYFLVEWPELSPKERGLISADLTGLLDPLANGELARLFGAPESNVSPDDILEGGKVVIVDVPVLEYRELGQFASLIWTLSTMRATQRRNYAPGDRPVFLYFDEAHLFAVPDQDARFQSVSRHVGASVCRITQSVPVLREAYGNQDAVDGLLGHCVTKICHTNACTVTNAWASKAIGQRTRVKESVSHNDREPGRLHTTLSTEDADACPPKTFLELRSGGPRNKGRVDAVIAQSGRELEPGESWIITEFRQETQ